MCGLVGMLLAEMPRSRSRSFVSGLAAPHPAVNKAARMLSEDPSLSGGNLAERLEVSAGRFARVFKSEMGVSLVQLPQSASARTFLEDHGRRRQQHARRGAGRRLRQLRPVPPRVPVAARSDTARLLRPQPSHALASRQAQADKGPPASGLGLRASGFEASGPRLSPRPTGLEAGRRGRGHSRSVGAGVDVAQARAGSIRLRLLVHRLQREVGLAHQQRCSRVTRPAAAPAPTVKLGDRRGPVARGWPPASARPARRPARPRRTIPAPRRSRSARGSTAGRGGASGSNWRTRIALSGASPRDTSISSTSSRDRSTTRPKRLAVFSASTDDALVSTAGATTSVSNANRFPETPPIQAHRWPTFARSGLPTTQVVPVFARLCGYAPILSCPSCPGRGP